MPARLKELDGLRILAAMLVVLSHITEGPHSGIPQILVPFCAGGTGVLIFFVLSGYVITRMLQRERSRTGTIALGQFYLRRSLRIWPVSYAYIAVAVTFVALHRATADPRLILLAAAHLWNYNMTLLSGDQTAQGYVIFGHFWSLALEEQFYWTWPLALLLLRGRASRVLIGLMLVLPLVRVVSYVLFPFSRGQLNAMLHTGLDPIALGALLALHEERLKVLVQRVTPALFYANIAFLLVAVPIITEYLRGGWSITYGHTLESLSAGLLIFSLAHGPDTALARLLRTPPFQFGGKISYSFYVWQQLFSLPTSILALAGPLAMVASLATATVSYYLIEKPFLILKDRLPRPRRAAGAA
jgi:peptidoglycan/LPS O-acetylase OafA/YrhL